MNFVMHDGRVVVERNEKATAEWRVEIDGVHCINLHLPDPPTAKIPEECLRDFLEGDGKRFLPDGKLDPKTLTEVFELDCREKEA